jgi:TonB family protein
MTSGALAGKAAPVRPECATSDRTNCTGRPQALPRPQAAELKLRLARHIAHFVEYPRHSQYRRETGSSLTAFVVGPSGQVSNIRTVRSSGFSDLDRSARQAVMASSPIPAGLIDYPRHDNEFMVPISFRQGW